MPLLLLLLILLEVGKEVEGPGELELFWRGGGDRFDPCKEAEPDADGGAYVCLVARAEPDADGGAYVCLVMGWCRSAEATDGRLNVRKVKNSMITADDLQRKTA